MHSLTTTACIYFLFKCLAHKVSEISCRNSQCHAPTWPPIPPPLSLSCQLLYGFFHAEGDGLAKEKMENKEYTVSNSQPALGCGIGILLQLSLNVLPTPYHPAFITRPPLTPHRFMPFTPISQHPTSLTSHLSPHHLSSLSLRSPAPPRSPGLQGHAH